jgi:hypothetical protein
MTRKQAIQRIWTYKALAVLIAVVSLALLFVGLMKGMYYEESGSPVLEKFVKNSIAFAYHKIPVISPIISTLWPYVPELRLFPLLSFDNIALLVIYVALWGGGFLFRAAQNLAEVVKAVDYQIAVDAIRESGRRLDPREGLNVPRNATFLGQVHEHYVAPVIVGVVVGIILFAFKMN